MLTNREMMINLLLDQLENSGKEFKRFCTDDAGASEEAMVYYNIQCPYFMGDERCLCKGMLDPDRDTCVTCKTKWLDSEIDL